MQCSVLMLIYLVFAYKTLQIIESSTVWFEITPLVVDIRVETLKKIITCLSM